MLITAWKETSIIETIFDKVGLRETEFINLLEATLRAENVDDGRLTKIAAEIVPHLWLSRGQKISAPSAALEFLLENGASELIKGKRPNSRRTQSGGYCDALTDATRRVRYFRFRVAVGPSALECAVEAHEQVDRRSTFVKRHHRVAGNIAAISALDFVPDRRQS